MIYSMGYSEGHHNAEAQGYAAQYPADTEQRIEACPTETHAALKACVEEAVAASHEAQRSERDLNAQRDMAEWARQLLIVSMATLVVGCVQYRLTGSPKLHQTGFAYEICKIHPEYGTLAIFESAVPISPRELSLRIPFDGPSIIN